MPQNGTDTRPLDNFEARAITRIVVRPMASGLPLGFFAFAVGTVLLACVELKWIGPVEKVPVVLILLGFVAPLELLSGVFGLLSRDTGSGTGMAIFGAGWVALSLCFLYGGLDGHSASVGIFLIVDSLAILSLFIGSIAAKPMMGIILLLAAARFLLAAIVQLGGKGLAAASGILGLITGALAVYGGLALLLEDVQQKTVLPVFRRKAARAALEGNLEDQLNRVATEAGVRQQL